MFSRWIVLMVGCGGAIVAQADQIWYVKADATGADDGTSWIDAFKELRDALDAAQAGDEIWVARGTYTPIRSVNRTRSFQLVSGVGVYGGFTGDETRRDQRNPDPWTNETVLSGDLNGDDASGGNRYENSLHVVSGSGVDDGAVLDGFTVQGGYADGEAELRGSGAGMINEGGSPLVTNCLFIDNVALDDGGGIRNVNDGNARIVNCAFIGNVATWGGGMACDRSAPTLRDCLFEGNQAAAGTGGGLVCLYSDPDVAGCMFLRNQSSGVGGAMDCFFSDPQITNCTFRFNKSTGDDGGAVSCYNSSPVMKNCLIANNAALDSNSRGGGIALRYSDPLLINCTIVRNHAQLFGGGLYGAFESSSTLANCILWGNTPDQIDASFDSFPTVTYSDVEGGYDGVGNLDVDPGFAFEADPHLAFDSPLIDAGTDAPPGGLPDEDLDGNARSLDGDENGSPGADVGVFEFNPSRPSIALSPAEIEVFAPEGGPDPDPVVLSVRNTGGGVLNWRMSEACPWLELIPSQGQSMGEVDDVSVQIHTRDLEYGTYTCELSIEDGQAVNNPRTVQVVLRVNKTFRVPRDFSTLQEAIDAAMDGDTVLVANGVYTGGGNRSISFRGKAILVQSEGGAAGCVIDTQGQSVGVIFNQEEDERSVLDGFTIVGGPGSASRRGGIACSGRSRPRILNCVITDGYTDYTGGGVSIYNADPTFIHCVIANNHAGDYGGGVYCGDGAPTFINCVIADNVAESNGGGVNSWGDTTLINCLITGNHSGLYGGGVHFNGGEERLVNCTLANNVADSRGGGLYTAFVQTSVVNTVLWNNAPQAVYAQESAPSITYSDIEGGWPGAGNVNADPLFVNPADGDYRLGTGSPCIDAGDNEGVFDDVADLDGDEITDEPTPFDLAGRARFIDDSDVADTGRGAAPLVDMGCHEYQAGAGCTDREKLKAACSNSSGRNVLTASVTKGEPGTTVVFFLDGVRPRERVLNAKGKTKATWGQSGQQVDSGPHEVTVELACGAVPSKTTSCP